MGRALAIFGFIFSFTVAAESLKPAQTASARDFAIELHKQIVDSLNGKSTPEVKKNSICSLVRKYIDIKTMGNQSLGKRVRVFPADMLPTYYESYVNMITNMVSMNFERIRTNKVTFATTIVDNGDGLKVEANVEVPNRPGNKLQFYLMAAPETQFKLVDAGMDGARLVFAIRNSTDTIFSNNGDDLKKAAQMVIESFNSSGVTCPAL